MSQDGAKQNVGRSAATGESEVEAARQVKFEPKPSAGPGAGPKPDTGDGAGDASQAARSKRNPDDDPEAKSAPGAVAPKDVTTESDDGVG